MMITDNDIQALVHQLEQKVADYYATAEQHFSRCFPRPEIKLNQRGRAAGTARPQTNELRFNLTLLVENQQAFIDQTVPHEIAHLLVYQLYGRTKPHGKEWQFMMQSVFNCPAKTTHQFDLKSVTGKQFTYDCRCMTHQLSIYRHNKVQRQQASYHCRKCKSPLVHRS